MGSLSMLLFMTGALVSAQDAEDFQPAVPGECRRTASYSLAIRTWPQPVRRIVTAWSPPPSSREVQPAADESVWRSNGIPFRVTVEGK